MGIFGRVKSLALWQKIVGGAVFCLLLYTVFGFLILPRILLNVSVDKLTSTLNRQTSIADIRFNPYTLRLDLADLVIREKDGKETFFGVSRLHVNLGTASLFKLAPVVQEVRIENPLLAITRNDDLSYNFSDLIPETEKTSPVADKADSRMFHFYVANIVLTDGRITVNDRPRAKIHRLTDMNIAIPFISNMDAHTDIFVTPRFSVAVDGAPFDLTAKSKPFTREMTTELTVSLHDIDLPGYAVYNPVDTHLDLAGGRMDLDCVIESRMEKEANGWPALFLSGQLRVTGLDIDGPGGQPLLDLKEFKLVLDRSPVFEGRINLKEAVFMDPTVSLVRDDRKQVNIFHLFPEKKAPQGVPGDRPSGGTDPGPSSGLPIELTCGRLGLENVSVRLTDSGNARDLLSLGLISFGNLNVNPARRLAEMDTVTVRDGGFTLCRLDDGQFNVAVLSPASSDGTASDADSPDKDADSRQDTESPAWTVAVNQMDFTELSFQADDLVGRGRGRVDLSHIGFRCENFSTARDRSARVNLDFTLNEHGRVTLSGPVGVNPLNTDLSVKAEQIQLERFAPFIMERVNLLVAGGAVSANGQVGLKKQDSGELTGRFTGDAGIADFSAMDSATTQELAAFKAFDLQGMTVDIRPFAAAIESVNLTSPEVNLLIGPDGSFNFSRIAKTDSSEPSDESAEQTARQGGGIPLEIGQVRISDGRIMVHDRSITPEFKTRLTRIDTQITGLSARETIRSDLSVSAMINNHTPLTIKGRINPLKTDFFCDMDVTLSDMDLGFLSPYAGKYAGYRIKKGKMTIDLSYLIDQRRLDSKNDLFLDQFDFGEKVKSEHAINAPVTLAVALLKDTAGRITLNLPVKGNLDDPEFSVGGIVVKMIVNLLVKAATAPFSLLGAMFGGGEDLNIIVFEPGQAFLTEQAARKIDTLIRALTERPGLKLDIQGYVHAETDRPALEEIALERLLRGEKLKFMAAAGNSGPSAGLSVDEIELLPDERQRFLRSVFDQTPEGQAVAEKAAGIAPPSADSTAETGNDEAPPSTGSEELKTDEAVEPALPVLLEPSLEDMITAVKKQIAVTPEDLRHLARERAQTVKDALLSEKKIDSGRIFTIESDTLVPETDKTASGAVIMTLK